MSSIYFPLNSSYIHNYIHIYISIKNRIQCYLRTCILNGNNNPPKLMIVLHGYMLFKLLHC